MGLLAIRTTFSTTPSLAAVPWQASSAFEDVFEYTAVDDSGQNHLFKVRYTGLLNHYKYQTGNARFPDDRTCHWGFSKQILRSFVASNDAVFDPRLVGKVNKEQIYTPDIWGSAAVNLIDFTGQVTLGASKPLEYLDKLVVQNIASIVGLKSGPNCGEVSNAIQAEFSTLMDTLRVARPIGEIDHLVIVLELQENYWIKPTPTESRRIKFIYPNNIKPEHRLLLSPLIDQAWAVNTLTDTPQDVRKKWSDRIGQPNWQQLMWEEFGLKGLEAIQTRVERDKIELPRLIQEAERAFNESPSCTSSTGASMIGVGPFLLKSADIETRCGNGCLPKTVPTIKTKTDVESLGRTLDGRIFLLDADLGRLQDIEDLAGFSGASATTAQTIRKDVETLRASVTSAKMQLEVRYPPADSNAVLDMTPGFAFISCLGGLQAERERICAAGPCF